jgi:hypothetical protein
MQSPEGCAGGAEPVAGLNRQAAKGASRVDETISLVGARTRAHVRFGARESKARARLLEHGNFLAATTSIIVPSAGGLYGPIIYVAATIPN